jgi:vacuolar-type H+-ATPase subunit I/STV1
MVKNLIAKFRKKQTVILSNEEKVNALRDKAMGLFDHMKKAHTDLGKINSELNQIVIAEDERIQQEIESHQHKITQLTNNKAKAVDEITMNEKIQSELVKFVR